MKYLLSGVVAIGLLFYSDKSFAEQKDLDNAYTFYADTRFIETEGISKCSPNNSDTIRIGSWKLTNDKTMLVIESNIDTLTFHIDSLTSAKATGTIQTTQGAFQSTFVAY